MSSSQIDTAISLITRPPRGIYNPRNLGDIKLDDDSIVVPRVPVSFLNSKGLTIMGSLYPQVGFPASNPKSCVIYLHGNAGTQVEGRFMVKYLAPRGIATFCFDFSGSGASDGESVSLGLNERQDTIDATEFLRKSLGIDKFILWGRSMGAATTFLAAGQIENLLGIIADSAYQSTKALFRDMANKVNIPSFFQAPALWYVKKQVNSKLNADIYDVSPEEEAAKLEVPIVFAHCAEDSFIPCSHSQNLFNAYKGKDKVIYHLPNDHNSKRPIEWLDVCYRFICRISDVEYDKVLAPSPPSNPDITQESPVNEATDQHFRSLEDMVNHSSI